MRVAALVLAIPVLGGCWPAVGPDDFDDMDLCPGGVSRVVVAPRAVALRLADTLRVEASTMDRAGTPNILCASPSWTSTDQSVVHATPEGLLTGVGPGSAYVRASVSGRTDSVLVTISTAAIASLVVIGMPADLRVGQVAPLAFTARDSAGNELPVRHVAWSSSRTSVAAMSAVGIVYAYGTGSATIRATAEGVIATVTAAPTRDAPAVRVTRIVAGERHACALAGGGGVPEGTAFCWGAAYSGAVGVAGAPPTVYTPLPVAPNLVFVDVAVGMDHTCAVTAAGEAHCWGANRSGQLGDGSTAARPTPVRVATTTALRGLAASGSATCGLAGDGTARCWGTWAGHARSAPGPLAGNRIFTRLTAGNRFVCGLSPEGLVYCWGELAGRSLAVPTLVSGAVRFSAIDAGAGAVCGVSIDRALHCWGSKTGPFWESATYDQQAPVAVPGGTGVDSVAVGSAALCVTAGTETKCLGTVWGQAEAFPTLSVLPRGADHAFARLALGNGHACAVDVVGGAWCWGNNLEGQIGVGSRVYTARPLQLRLP